MTLENVIYNGRYQLYETLGQGGMGIVYRASDRLTGDIVALKQIILPGDTSTSGNTLVDASELRLALAHEFQTLASLRHPHIISVLDYGFHAVQDGSPNQDNAPQPFFTMSYLQDGQTIINAGAGLPTEGRVHLLRQMLEALAYLHQRGILHRDLKAENVLVTNNTLRLLDFGLAVAKGKATSSAGTWAYVAPELLESPSATEAADLYAVGVIAYQLFANRLPFDPANHDFMDQLLDQPPDLSPLAENSALIPIISRLLAKDPAERYPHAAACIAAFSQALAQPLPSESVAVRESYLQAAAFVGREEEKAHLLDALAKAQAGQGSTWLVGGESGVGKSRLFEEIRIQALVQGALVLRGQGIEGTGGLPYQLWRDAVRRLVLTTECDDLIVGVLQTLVPDIGSLLQREVLPAPELEGQAAKQRLVSTVTNLFRGQTQ